MDLSLGRNASGENESRPSDLMMWVLNHQKLLSCGCHSWLCSRLGIFYWDEPASLGSQE